jgi:hypothetical protein
MSFQTLHLGKTNVGINIHKIRLPLPPPQATRGRLRFTFNVTARAVHADSTYSCAPPSLREPPDKFIGRALRVNRSTGGKVAMLLNLGLLAHPTHHQVVQQPRRPRFALR